MRIALMVFRMLFRINYYMHGIRKAARKGNDYENGARATRRAVIRVNRAGRVKIETEGIENLPKQDGFLITPNHQGMFDVLALYEAIENPFSFVMKKEAMNWPLVKSVRKATCSLAMDRSDVRQSMKVILDVTSALEQGRNFVIFPEGTRSKMGNRMNEMKAGSFKAACKAQAPIVPVALVDSFKPFDEQSIKKTTVHVFILPALCYDEYKDMSTQEIATLVRGRIEERISSYLKAAGREQELQVRESEQEVEE